MDPCHRLVDDLLSRTHIHQAMAHVHVVMVVGVETTDVREGQSPHRHVGSNESSERCLLLRKPGIGASEHPVELERKPARSSFLELRYGSATHSDDDLVQIRQPNSVQPIRICPGVVVEKSHDVTTGDLNCRISRRSETTLVPVGKHHHGGRGTVGLVGPLPSTPLEKRVIVIHADDDLQRAPTLALDRRHRSHEKRPTFLGIRTDNDGRSQRHQFRRHPVRVFDNGQGRRHQQCSEPPFSSNPLQFINAQPFAFDASVYGTATAAPNGSGAGHEPFALGGHSNRERHHWQHSKSSL